MANIYHRPGDAKVLYDFTLLSEAEDDPNRVVFLSQRDISILLTATELADKLRHRVFYDAVVNNYNTVSPEDFDEFAIWINELRNRLGGWIVSNELLERIAVALESIDEKTGAFITWQEMLDDIENVLGINNIFVSLIRTFLDLFPSLKVKADATPLLMAFFEYYSFKAPVLALLGTMSGALTVMAASSVAEKGIAIYRAALATIDTWVNTVNHWIDFFLGDWNVYQDFLKPLLDEFFPDSQGGTGGENPDNDPTLRTAVNVATTFSPTVNVDCASCGGGGCSACSVDQLPGTQDWVQPPLNEGQPSPSEPPASYPGTIEEYNVYKCKAATLLVDAYISYVENFERANPVLASLGPSSLFVSLAGFFADVISSALALFLFAYDVTITVGFAGLSAFLEDYLEYLEGVREEFICDLYGAITAEQAYSAIQYHIETGASELTFPTLWSETHVSNLFPASVINILFEEDARAVAVEGEDCSTCLPNCWSFDSSLEGWSELREWCAEGAEVSWSSGQMLFQANANTENCAGSYLLSPPMNYKVRTGDVWYFNKAAESFSINFQWEYDTGSGWEVLNGGNVGGATTYVEESLAAIVDETITRLRLRVIRSTNLAWSTTFDNMCVGEEAE